MSSNVGLSTPRGSGTSGYIQRNLSVLKPRSNGTGAPYSLDATRGPPKTHRPDQAILAHDRLREVEVKVLELRDRLEDEGEQDDDAVDAKCDQLRTRLIAELEGKSGQKGTRKGHGQDQQSRGSIKNYQVHELAEAKAKESEKLRRALGLSGGRGQRAGNVGGAGTAEEHEEDMQEHPMARQERQKRERQMERARVEIEREERDQLQQERRRESGRDRDRDRDRNRDRSRSPR